MSSKTIDCSSLKNKNLEETLREISKRVNKKWMLLFVFFVIATFLAYMFFVNVKDIYHAYTRYKANIQEKEKSRSSLTTQSMMNSAFDDEIYTNPAKRYTDPSYDKDVGKAIRTKLEDIKTEYKEYNRALRQNNTDAKDFIDETILDSTQDNY
jgi:hypothetical protein